MNNIKSILAAFSFALLTLAPPVVQAADDSLPTYTVRFPEADLHSTSGNREIYSQIQHAADRVCGDVDGRDLQRVTARKLCMKDAIARAVRMINNPHLTEYLSSRKDGQGLLSVSSNMSIDTPR